MCHKLLKSDSVKLCPHLVLLWQPDVIKRRQDVAQTLQLQLLFLNGSVCSGQRNVPAVSQRQEVREHLLAKRVGVASPPGCGVTMATVTLRTCGVQQKLAGSDQSRQEVVAQLR